MSDPIDRGQRRDELFREFALAAWRTNAVNGRRQPRGDGTCIDCGEAIHPARLAVDPPPARCLECQVEYEADEARRWRAAHPGEE